MIQADLPEPAASADGRDTVIQARGLTRYFGRKCAADGLSFDVPRGSVFAFIGRNGAGKTTTIRMLLGLLEPTRGSSSVLGHDSARLPPEVRARIGYMAEGHPVYAWMRVSQCASFQRGCYSHWNHDVFSAVIDNFSIDPRTKAGHLSHGQRAGLHLAMTLAVEPELLVLDDPATGLDPAARRSLLEAMLYYTRGHDRTIFFSSHLLDEVERVADYVARPGLQRPAGLLHRRDVLRARAAAGRALPSPAAAGAAGAGGPAPGGPFRGRAEPHRGQPLRPDAPGAPRPGRRNSGRATPRPGRRPDRLRRPAG
jgi:ABC-type Na+ transport system ATPase subunit NatA